MMRRWDNKTAGAAPAVLLITRLATRLAEWVARV
jgi:hypothetical protein